ncbi:conjugal transfer protein [Streptomyces sp. NBC_00513]|uniref:conjugal transfer protein n=1 Tax=unclassified Streptomyces TaxID=2593676 RepID=UPI00225056C6|nr:conjugal transfer protein [Streptomyces sp. NBC_00424]MCX5074313.1 conjugal transfer protein [Streptomyces sp. NBC_00424]WUD42494.1 conjugal transfer protein [Streptomyces sp. NBC_00513]
MATRNALSKAQKIVLTAAFVPMFATGVAGGVGTYSNISRAYGSGTALGAVAAGEGATAVLALVLLGLTMLGQSSPGIIRIGLWALPAAASVMAAMAADDPGRTVIYAVTPMGMCVAAEGMAFLARRIVVHQDGRDMEAEAKAAAVVQALAYHRARAANHPQSRVRKSSDRTSWRLARRVGLGDASLGARLLDVQRERLTHGADAALAAMFITPTNQDETTEFTVNRLGCDLRESAAEAPTATAELMAAESADPVPTIEPVALTESVPVVEPVELPQSAPVKAVAAAESAPRRATGRVPKSARTPRPTRDSDELLDEARSVTANWSDGELTAEAIRKAVRTSSARGRLLRDTLKAERAAAEVTAA